MRLEKIAPDVVTANTVIYGYGVMLDADAAVRVVEDFMPR